MATRNLSKYNQSDIPDASDMRFGIVVSDWNSKITHALLDGAVETLLKNGMKKDEIIVRHVPGSFELPLAAQWFAEYDDVDGVICLGCVIKGETPHFTYVCQ
ncbi:MAG: 6,7-dimethyl-8-ribityllumazine synthase, partial [Bacteroidia bacterium]